MKIRREELQKIVKDRIDSNQSIIDKATKSKKERDWDRGLEAIGFRKGVEWLMDLFKNYEVEE